MLKCLIVNACFQDEAVVNVVQLKGIRIFAPLTRLQTGTKVSHEVIEIITRVSLGIGSIMYWE